jgi:ribosome-associated toxin RatA of RatAB toxin-antitoxin module
MSLALAMALAAAISGSDEARLVRGDVILTMQRDPAGASGQVEAWIDIPAPPSLVWSTMNDCAHAAKFVPNLVSCTVIATDPAGAWEIREHIANPGWLLPNVRSRFRADFEPERIMRFAQIDGDFEVMQGQWTLTPLEAGAGTRLRYEARLKPKTWAPDFLVREIVETDAPNTLKALRQEVIRRKTPN